MGRISSGESPRGRVFTYFVNDPSGNCDPVRVAVLAVSAVAARRAVRGAGFKLPRTAKPLPLVPEEVQARAMAADGVVVWRCELPDGTGRWHGSGEL